MDSTVQLQGVGRVAAKRASDLVEGDVTVWNYGGTYRVLAVEKLSPKFVRLILASEKSPMGTEPGKVWHRRTGIDFMVGVTK